MSYAFRLMQLLGIYYNNPAALNHNIVVATTNRLFYDVCRAVSKFKNAVSVKFSTFEGFYCFLKHNKLLKK
jgi:hypothetical protein